MSGPGDVWSRGVSGPGGLLPGGSGPGGLCSGEVSGLGGVYSRGCLVRGVSAPGGSCLGGGCLLQGVCSQGVSAPEGCLLPGGLLRGGCIPACTEADTLPTLWTEFLTHACEILPWPNFVAAGKKGAALLSRQIKVDLYGKGRICSCI